MNTPPIIGQVDQSDLSKRVTALTAQEFKVIPEQVAEFLANLANLLFEICALVGTPRLRIRTDEWFASGLVPREMLVREISYSTGLPVDASTRLLGVISGQLREQFLAHNIQDPGKAFWLRPIGAIEIRSLKGKGPTYWFNYTDPASENYNSFLFGTTRTGISKPFTTWPAILEAAVPRLRELAERRGQPLEITGGDKDQFSANTYALSTFLRRLLTDVLLNTPVGTRLLVNTELSSWPRELRLTIRGELDFETFREVLTARSGRPSPNLEFEYELHSRDIRFETAKLTLERAVGGHTRTVVGLSLDALEM